MNAALLLLWFTGRRSADALVDTKLNGAALHAARWPKQQRFNSFVAAGFVPSPPKTLPQRANRLYPAVSYTRDRVPARLTCARELRRGRWLHFMQATCNSDNEALDSGVWPSAGGSGDAIAAAKAGVAGEDEGETAGFGWLREFGNGNMDIAGLVLSTVLLMTAAVPLG